MDTIAYSDLPDDVQEHVADPANWEELDPDNIHVTECVSCNDTLYDVELKQDCYLCGWHRCYISKWGHTHGEHIGDPGGLYYAPDSDGHVMCDGCRESLDHGGNTIIAVYPDGTTTKVVHSGGVLMDMGMHTMEQEPRDSHGLENVIEAIVTGTSYVKTDGWRGYDDGPSSADGFSKVSSGWHSTMERSDLSDRINTLTSGDTPFNFPVIVHFTTTSNVCSTGLDIYAPDDMADNVTDVLTGETAAPGHAGLS